MLAEPVVTLRQPCMHSRAHAHILSHNSMTKWQLNQLPDAQFWLPTPPWASTLSRIFLERLEGATTGVRYWGRIEPYGTADGKMPINHERLWSFSLKSISNLKKHPWELSGGLHLSRVNPWPWEEQSLQHIGRFPASQSNSSPQSCPRSFLDLLPQELFLFTDAMRIAKPIMTGEEGVLGSPRMLLHTAFRVTNTDCMMQWLMGWSCRHNSDFTVATEPPVDSMDSIDLNGSRVQEHVALNICV